MYLRLVLFTIGYMKEANNYEAACLQEWVTKEIAEPVGHNLLKVWPAGEYTVLKDAGLAGNTGINNSILLQFSFPHKFRGSSEIERVTSQRLYNPIALRARGLTDDMGLLVETESRVLAAGLCQRLMEQP